MGIEYSPNKFFKEKYHTTKNYSIELLEEIGETSAKLQINYSTKRLEGLKRVDFWWDQRTLNKCFKKAGFKEMEYLRPKSHQYAQEFIQNFANDGTAAFFIAKKEEKVNLD